MHFISWIMHFMKHTNATKHTWMLIVLCHCHFSCSWKWSFYSPLPFVHYLLCWGPPSWRASWKIGGGWGLIQYLTIPTRRWVENKGKRGDSRVPTHWDFLNILETLVKGICVDTGHPRNEPSPGEDAAAGLPLLVPGPPRVRGLHPPPAGARQPPVPAGQPGHRAAARQRRARHRHCLLQTGQGGEEECTTIIYWNLRPRVYELYRNNGK